MAVVGSEFVDVTQIDVESLTLARADGVGGVLTPLTGPPGPGIRIEDVAAPLDGEPCNCHALTGDGIDALLLKFSTRDLVEARELTSLPRREPIMLTLSGYLLDGTEFEASDCIILPGKQ